MKVIITTDFEASILRNIYKIYIIYIIYIKLMSTVLWLRLAVLATGK